MKKLTFLAGVVFFLFSCNSGNKDSSETSSENANETISRADDGRSSDCLKDFQEDYSKLLTKEEMSSVYPFDFDKAKHDLRSGSYGEYVFRWESDREPIETTILNQTIKGPDYNSMGVALLSFYSDDSEMKSTRELFDRGYKTLSEKELKEIEDNIAKQSAEVKESAEGFMKVRKKSQWEFVDGLGSSAWYKWNEKYGGELAVLSGKASFYIRLKLSADPEENLGYAKKLAQKVIDKCN